MVSKKLLLIISAHEGSDSWQKTIKLCNNENIVCKQISILKDNDYRTNSAVKKIYNRFYIYVFFTLFLFSKIPLILKAENYLIITSPFYLPPLLSVFLPPKKIIILHNDLYPEGFKHFKFSFIFKFLYKVFNYFPEKRIKKCKHHIFLSSEHLKLRKYKNSIVIHPPAFKPSEISIKYPKNSSKISIGYCGTLGFNHCGLEFLELLKHSRFNNYFSFQFNISGAQQVNFNRKIKTFNKHNKNYEVLTGGSLSQKNYDKFMRNLDFGLILLKSNSSDTVFPSKLSAHLAFNHPVILISDQKNLIHEFIIKNKIGISINLNDRNLNELSNLYNDDMVTSMKKNVAICFENEFSSTQFSSKLQKIVNQTNF